MGKLFTFKRNSRKLYQRDIRVILELNIIFNVQRDRCEVRGQRYSTTVLKVLNS